MLRVRSHRDRKHVLVAYQEAKRDLARRRAVSLGDLRQHLSSPARLVGKSAGTEWAIPHNRHPMTLTPRQHVVLDLTFEQAISELIEATQVLPRNRASALLIATSDVVPADMPN